MTKVILGEEGGGTLPGDKGQQTWGGFLNRVLVFVQHKIKKGSAKFLQELQKVQGLVTNCLLFVLLFLAELP